MVAKPSTKPALKRTPDVLKLTLRKNIYSKRDVTFRLTLRSLGLVLWLSLGVLLLYEITTLSLGWLLWKYKRDRARKCVKKQDEEIGCDEYATEMIEDKSNQVSRLAMLFKMGGRGPAKLPGWSPTINHHHHQYRPREKIENAASIASHVLLVLVWTLATLYAIFYSYEMVFLYINDRWYQLLGLQLVMTLSDTLTWMAAIAITKYKLCCTTTPWVANVCCIIKVLHLVFNILVEADWWNIRHWLFLLEDATYLCLAPVLLDMGQSPPLSAHSRSRLLYGLVGCVAASCILFKSLPGFERLT